MIIVLSDLNNDILKISLRRKQESPCSVPYLSFIISRNIQSQPSNSLELYFVIVQNLLAQLQPQQSFLILKRLTIFNCSLSILKEIKFLLKETSRRKKSNSPLQVKMEQTEKTLPASPQLTNVGSSTNNGSSKKIQSNTEQQNTQSGDTLISLKQKLVTLHPVGFLNEISEPLPAITIMEISQAYERLTALKSKANLMDGHNRKATDTELCINYVVACCAVGPFSLCCVPWVESQRENEVRSAVEKVLRQINELRENFSSDPSWSQVEESYKLEESIFIPEGLVDRSVLKGPL